MGLEDREWFRADQKQRLERIAHTPFRFGPLNKGFLVAIGLAGGIALASILPVPGITRFNTPGVAVMEPRDAGQWPFPPQGAVQFHVSSWHGPLGTLTIVGPSQGPERHFAIRIRDWYKDTPISTLYLRSGETLNVDLPIGAYRLAFAEGKGWQGYDQLFGPSITFSSGTQPAVIALGN